MISVRVSTEVSYSTTNLPEPKPGLFAMDTTRVTSSPGSTVALETETSALPAASAAGAMITVRSATRRRAINVFFIVLVLLFV